MLILLFKSYLAASELYLKFKMVSGASPYMNLYILTCKMVKSAFESSGPSGRRSVSGFCGMKRLGVFLLSPGWDASPSQGCP